MLRRHHLLRRRLADPLVRVLVLLQCLATMPLPAAAQSTVAPAASSQPSKRAEAAEASPEPETPVTVNRTPPAVTAPDLTVRFEETPSSVDLARAHVLPIPLRPAGGLPSLQENRDLGRALEAFASSRSTRMLEEFAARYPRSPWRPSLLVNLGKLKWREGYFSRAAGLWDEAWQLTKDGTERAVRDVADIALSEWLTHAMTFGQVSALQQKLDEVGQRAIGGQAGNKVTEAREGLWQLTNHHEMAVYSGPEALKALLSVTRAGAPKAIQQIDAYHPVHEGTSLAALQRLAQEASVALEMRFIEDATQIPVPSIVHLKSEHYSAVIATRNDAFVLRDPALGGEMVISANALRDEGSGYVLVPASSGVPIGRDVGAAEAERIVGRCHPGLPGEDTCNCGGGTGLASYTLHQSMAAIVVTDTPLTYTPPRGPVMSWTLRYNHRSTRLSSVPTSSHVGPLWSFDWLSYVWDNNTMIVAPFAWTEVILRGEGKEMFTTYDSSMYWRSRATLVKVANDPPRYERRLPDGTVEVFTFPDRAASLPNRKIFLTEVIDPQGNTVSFTYDGTFRLVGVTDAVGQVTTLSYENASDPLLITKITDPFGRTALLGYDGSGRLISITDAIGMTSQFAYDDTDFMTAMTTPYGTTTFRRGPDSLAGGQFRRVEATDPEGGTERLEYHLGTTSGLPATVSPTEVPTGFAAWNQEMDQYNSLYWSKQAMAVAPGALSSAVITRWLLAPQMAFAMPWVWNIAHSIKRPLETRLWYRYPDQVPTNWNAGGTGRSPTLIARVLDGGVTQLTQMTYNAQGMVTSKADPVGRQTTYTYAANGIDLLEVRQLTGTGSDLLAAYGGYNAQHLPATMTDGAGQTTTTTYNAVGRPATVTNAKKETTTYTYDTGPTGYLLSISGPVTGATTTLSYDAHGRTQTVTDSDGYALTTDYDGLNRVIKRTYPDGTFEQLTYQRLEVSELRDRKGLVTRHYYDGLGRRTATRDPLGRIIRWKWCECGSLDALIDAKGQQTSWERDAQGRATREVRADGTTDTVYTYDATGRLKTVTDPKQQVTTQAYFADDSLSSTTYTNAVIATPTVMYTYSPVYPRITTMVDGTGSTTYTYKSAGQLGAGQIATVDGPLNNDVLAYAYDELGRITERSINGSANTATWAFDSLGRITSEANMLGTFAYTYDGATSRLIMVSYPNGQTSTYTYLPANQDHRLQTIHHKYPGGATLSKFDYTYDVIGNILTWQQQADSDPAMLWVYGYDSVDQLTSAIKQSTGGSPTMLKRYAYGYDPAGNRTFEQIDNQVTAATHDIHNRLLAHTQGGPMLFRGSLNEPATVMIQGSPATVDSSNAFRGAPTLSGGTNTISITATDPSGNQATRQYNVGGTGGARAFTYDANGNLTSDGARNFEWDARNRLTKLTEGSTSITYSYDGYSRRTAAVTKSGTTTVKETHNLWCGLTVCEIRGSVGAPVLTAQYRFAVVSDGVPSYVVRDHLMSVRDVTDANGSLMARYDFGPWGDRTLLQGTDITSLGFTGQSSSRADTWSMAYRDYDATTARWLNQDPLGLAGGINLYGYVQGNPLKRVDPLGLVTTSISAPKIVRMSVLELGSCGAYEANADFSGDCKCTASGYQADLFVSFHPKISVAVDIVTPPERTIRHELDVHHSRAESLVKQGIAEGGALEQRAFGSYEGCKAAVTSWADKYNRLVNRTYSLGEALADIYGYFWCNKRVTGSLA
jgi:RHS repeat-associated protein